MIPEPEAELEVSLGAVEVLTLGEIYDDEDDSVSVFCESSAPEYIIFDVESMSVTIKPTSKTVIPRAIDSMVEESIVITLVDDNSNGSRSTSYKTLVHINTEGYEEEAQEQSQTEDEIIEEEEIIED